MTDGAGREPGRRGPALLRAGHVADREFGVACGAGLSVWAVTFARTLLYGVEPRDPVTFAAAAVLLTLVAALAAMAARPPRIHASTPCAC